MSSLRRLVFPLDVIVEGVVAIVRGVIRRVRCADNPLSKALWILSGLVGLAAMAALAFALWWVAEVFHQLSLGFR